MKDDFTDIEWLRDRIGKAARHAEALSDDIAVQDGMRLTGTVMRLDRVRGSLEEAWTTLQQVYDEALERDRTLSADRAVSDPPSGSEGVVADVLRAAAAGFRQPGGDAGSGGIGSADVGRR